MGSETKGSKVKTKHSQFIKMKGHPGYEKNPDTGMIRFRKTVRKGEKRTIIYTGKTKITHAKEVVNEKLAEILTGSAVRAKRERQGVTSPFLKDIWEEELLKARQDKGIGKSTMIKYGVSWNHGIKEFWGHLTPRDVTQAKVREWQGWYLKNHPKRTFFNTRKHLTMFFRFLKSEKYITDQPEIDDLDKVIKVRTKAKKVGRVYTDHEIARLLNACDDERVSRSAEVKFRTKIAILIGRFMGCRKMEILSSEWKDWHLDKGYAEIWSAKNKKWRKVPIPAFLIAELKAYRPIARKSKFLFPSASGERHIPSQVYDQFWTKAKQVAEITGWDVKNAARVHDLRHTFATITARDKWSPTQAAKILDMSIKEYERTYVHLTWEDVVEQMEGSFGKVPEAK